MEIFKSVNSDGDVIVFARNSVKKNKKNSLTFGKKMFKFHKDIKKNHQKLKIF